MSNPSIAEIAENAGLTESQLIEAAREPGVARDLVVQVLSNEIETMRETMREVERRFNQQ